MADEFRPEAFGQRLRNAMALKGLDVKTLQARVQGAGRGTSYGSIWSYVNGKAPVEPRVEVVGAIARAVDQLPQFLLFGSGPRTVAEAAAMGGDAHEGPDLRPPAEREADARWQAVYRALKEAESRLPGLGAMFFHGREQVVERLAWALLGSGVRPLEEYTPEQVGEAVYLLAWLIGLPGQALQTVDYLNSGAGPAYFMAMATALETAMPKPGRGYPTNALASLRAAKDAWDSRFPIPMSDAAFEEMRPRGPTKRTSKGRRKNA